LIEHGKIGEIYNVAGGFEQQNIETVRQVVSEFMGVVNWYDFEPDDVFMDFSCNRKGQDVRYALDDSKLRSLGWEPKSLFSEEINRIVSYYKNKFIW
jgi:dTDP-glucose 4,6-dehydratase